MSSIFNYIVFFFIEICELRKIEKKWVFVLLLRFDGDMVNFNETPDDMELEGGEILDCFLAK